MVQWLDTEPTTSTMFPGGLHAAAARRAVAIGGTVTRGAAAAAVAVPVFEGGEAATRPTKAEKMRRALPRTQDGR